MAVGADWGGVFVYSILVGLEFGAVGGSKFCKNGSAWADNGVGRMVGAGAGF